MTQPSSTQRSVTTPAAPLPPDFRAFHQLYRPAYVRWAELHLGARQDAEEAVDRTFEQLAEDWSAALTMDSPASYAWTILKDCTLRAARARGRRPVVMDTAAFETSALHNAVDPIGELEDSLSIYQAIRELPDRQHDVIVLLYCLGYSAMETADILGISVAGVHSTARYARHRLKEALGLGGAGGTDDLTD